MIIVPNSYGSVLREDNSCHEPAGQPTGGQFCSTGGVDPLADVLKVAAAGVLKGFERALAYGRPRGVHGDEPFTRGIIETDDPVRMRFVLPNGRRIGHETTSMEHDDIVVSLGVRRSDTRRPAGLEAALAAGIARVSPGSFGGFEIGVPLTYAQAQVLADDWEAAGGDSPLYADARSTDGRRMLASKVFKRVTAKGLYTWSRHLYANALREANDCHTPAGSSAGGQFCSKTVKAYKLFRVDARHPGKLFPLFVNATSPVPVGTWVAASEGPRTGAAHVKSRLGPLAYRPGWHAGDLPIATHIGSKSATGLTKPDLRSEDHVWAEVELPADVDWQTVANQRGRNKQGRLIAGKAHITDQIPHGGYYRYKTNPNMVGQWMISGGMRVVRVLTDTEVAKINAAAGVADLPRARPFEADRYGFASTKKARRT